MRETEILLHPGLQAKATLLKKNLPWSPLLAERSYLTSLLSAQMPLTDRTGTMRCVPPKSSRKLELMCRAGELGKIAFDVVLSVPSRPNLTLNRKLDTGGLPLIQHPQSVYVSVVARDVRLRALSPPKLLTAQPTPSAQYDKARSRQVR